MTKTAIKTKAYAAVSAGGEVKPHEIERREPGPYDVLIDIKFCGVCHSDVHQVKDDWGGAIYPMVPGHEIAGIVERVGEKVTKFKAGDRVGVGCMVDSCKECGSCADGDENYCEKGNIQTYNAMSLDGKNINFGGYSERITVLERFVARIPDKIGRAHV